MKSFGVWIATAALGAALVASGSAVAFEDGGQPELAAAAAARLALVAAIPITPLVAAILAAPPRIGNYCAAAGVTCSLSQPSQFGDECLCRAYGGYTQGFVQ
jgi:hypothetical protein